MQDNTKQQHIAYRCLLTDILYMCVFCVTVISLCFDNDCNKEATYLLTYLLTY